MFVSAGTHVLMSVYKEGCIQGGRRREAKGFHLKWYIIFFEVRF